MLQPALRCIQHSACPILLVPLVLLVLGPWDGDGEGGGQPPLSVGGYRLSGSASVGYRFVEIDSGSEDLYREVVNLEEGPRLFNFTLRGDRTDEQRNCSTVFTSKRPTSAIRIPGLICTWRRMRSTNST